MMPIRSGPFISQLPGGSCVWCLVSAKGALGQSMVFPQCNIQEQLRKDSVLL